MAEEVQEQQQEEREPVEGMELPEGFADVLTGEGPEGLDGQPAAGPEGLTEKEKSVLSVSEKIIEKASILIHQGFDKSMKKRGRPGFREVPADEVGKVAALCIPDKIKAQHPVVVYLSLMAGVMADNFVISVPAESEGIEENTQE